MDWLKKNLFFIGWGALALVLTAVAVGFWFTQKEQDTRLETDVASRRGEMQNLLRANPQPNPTNIARAKAEQERVQQLAGEARKLFSARAAQRLDNAGFRRQLEETLAQLAREAGNARVNVPTNYAFSFEVQRRAVNFVPGSIDPLLARLDEVKHLCTALYQARVHSLESVRRISVATDDAGTAADILIQQTARTNAISPAVAYPYELTFTCFSRELGLVLDSYLKSPPFIIIKNIAVEPAPLAVAAGVVPTAGLSAVAPSPDVVPAAGDDAAPRAPVFTPLAPRPGAARGPTGPQTLLDQRLLRVTLSLEILNLPPAK
jgi:hypothetical protein